MTRIGVRFVRVYRGGNPDGQHYPALCARAQQVTVMLPLMTPVGVIIRRPETFDDLHESSMDPEVALARLNEFKKISCTPQGQRLLEWFIDRGYEREGVLDAKEFTNEEWK